MSETYLDALQAQYHTLARYLDFDNQGEVLGYGCGSPSMTSRTKYMKEAYELGRNL